MIKISFTGDVSLDKPLLKAARNNMEEYSFERVFKDILPVFEESELVVGNLETVFGGAEQGYNVKPFSYNSPDAFLTDLKHCGFNMFSIANNHCMDEGIEGLKRTVHLCEHNNIAVTGIKKDGKNYIIQNVAGVNIAFIAYTQTINKSKSTDRIENIQNYVNLLYPYNTKNSLSIKQRMIHAMPLGLRENVKKIMKIPTVTKVTDSLSVNMKNESYLSRLLETIEDAKKNADIVVMCVHCGGQFNDAPGDYCEYIYKIMRDAGVDIIVGNHPHVIHKIETSNNQIAAYSLGGFTLSPSAEYVHQEAFADYSLIVHVYIDEKLKEVQMVSYSLVHGIEDTNQYLYLQMADIENDSKAQCLRARVGKDFGYKYDNKNEIVILKNRLKEMQDGL